MKIPRNHDISQDFAHISHVFEVQEQEDEVAQDVRQGNLVRTEILSGIP